MLQNVCAHTFLLEKLKSSVASCSGKMAGTQMLTQGSQKGIYLKNNIFRVALEVKNSHREKDRSPGILFLLSDCCSSGAIPRTHPQNILMQEWREGLSENNHTCWKTCPALISLTTVQTEISLLTRYFSWNLWHCWPWFCYYYSTWRRLKVTEVGISEVFSATLKLIWERKKQHT